MTKSKENIHKPFMNEKKNSKTIIIVVHGIVEGPNGFKAFEKQLERVLLLFSSFIKWTWNKW